MNHMIKRKKPGKNRENPELTFWKEVFNFQNLTEGDDEHNKKQVMQRLKAYGFQTNKAYMLELQLNETKAYIRLARQDFQSQH